MKNLSTHTSTRAIPDISNLVVATENPVFLYLIPCENFDSVSIRIFRFSVLSSVVVFKNVNKIETSFNLFQNHSVVQSLSRLVHCVGSVRL